MVLCETGKLRKQIGVATQVVAPHVWIHVRCDTCIDLLSHFVVEASRHIPVKSLPSTVCRPWLSLCAWPFEFCDKILGVHGWLKQTSGAIFCTQSATTRLHHWRARAGTFSPYHHRSINIGSNFNWTLTSHPTPTPPPPHRNPTSPHPTPSSPQHQNWKQLQLNVNIPPHPTPTPP